jgi:diguanylate cyclase (GGDEF)-like protein
MNQPPTGIVLPADLLTSHWFVLLLTLVAFNTIIYVGLTVAKLIPMPRQLHPSRVRLWMRALGMDPEKETTVGRFHQSDPLAPADPYDQLRRSIVSRDVPLAFGIAGVLVICVATTAMIALGSYGMTLHLVELAAGVLLLICAQVFGLRRFRASTVMWSWAIACVLIVAICIVRALYYESPHALAYAYIVMTAFAPITLFWRPSIIAGLLMLATFTTATKLTEGRDDIRIVVAALTALLVGAMLLRLRLRAIAESNHEKERSQELVTTDVLTGMLTRRGLLTIMPAVAAIAERTGEQVCLMCFGIPGLAKANAQYGVDYGDVVLRAVAKTLQKAVRRGDLVARWQGDEFVVAGIGTRPNAEDLAARVSEALHINGVHLGKWPTTVSAGTAAGHPGETTFDELLSQARAQREVSESADPTVAS